MDSSYPLPLALSFFLFLCLIDHIISRYAYTIIWCIIITRIDNYLCLLFKAIQILLQIRLFIMSFICFLSFCSCLFLFWAFVLWLLFLGKHEVLWFFIISNWWVLIMFLFILQPPKYIILLQISIPHMLSIVSCVRSKSVLDTVSTHIIFTITTWDLYLIILIDPILFLLQRDLLLAVLVVSCCKFVMMLCWWLMETVKF